MEFYLSNNYCVLGTVLAAYLSTYVSSATHVLKFYS